MATSRVKNTRRNIIWSYIDYLVTIVFQFVSRTIIVYFLGSQFLGLSSLFSSIIQVLNMAELGFSTAIVYNLYKPIAENDNDTICALLAFYRKIYRIVGSIVIIIGLVLLPFIKLLIKGSYPASINIYLLYTLFLLNTGCSYFLFAYKSSLLNALQRMDLVKVAYTIVNIIQCLFQLAVLLLYKNYYFFVLGTIFGTCLKNILAGFFARKYFPQYECKGNISNSLKISIWKRVRGLLICRISGMTYTTFDSIILSSMVGLVSVAIYNNYFTIYSSIANIIILIRHAMQASVGNSIASESIEKNLHDVFIWQFLFSVIAIWCSICLLCLYQPFMLLWMGKEMMLSTLDVVLWCLLFWISTVQHSFYLYLSGNGLWWELRWPYIFSTIANLTMNIVFCKMWGVTGIIASTLIAQFVFGLIWQSAIIFKVYFKQSVRLFYKKQLMYFCFGTITAAMTLIICNLIDVEGLLGLFLKMIICVIIPAICIYIFYFRTKAFKQSKQLMIKFIKK